MKKHRNGLRNMMAMLLSLTLLAGIFVVPALSEPTAASPSDLTEAAEPAVQAEQPEERGSGTPAAPEAAETPSEPEAAETPAETEIPSEDEASPEAAPESEASPETAPEAPSEPEAPSDPAAPSQPETEEPFSQTETLDEIRITVSADAGVFPAGAKLAIAAANDTDVIRAVETALGITSGSDAVLRHAQYRFSCDAMNGKARISMEHLGLTDLQARYPDAKICVFVLKYSPADRSAQIIPANTDIPQNTIAFTLEEPGLYDILTMVQPGQETPSEEQPETEQAEAEQSETEQVEAEQPEAAEENDSQAELSAAAAPAETENTEEQGVLAASDPIPTDKISQFVARCYRLILNREPDANGISYWADLLRSKQKTAAEVISGFLSSTEFSRMKKSPDELVTIMYQTMLDRQPEASGKKYWHNLIMDGMTVAQLVNGFCGSAEFKNICAGYGIVSGSVPEKGSDTISAFTPGVVAFVTRCYRVALDREPEDAGLVYWCKRIMSQTTSYKDVGEGFMLSTEMNNKHLSNEAFIRKLYLLYLDREAEPAGLEYWLGQLNGGMSRKEANKGFANSMEFMALAASFELESTHMIIASDTELTVKNGGKAHLQVGTDLAPAGSSLVWSSSDENIFTVGQDGTVFGVYPGQARLTITLKSGEKVKDLTIKVQANYRALLFSISTYGPEGTFYRNQGDVRSMKQALGSVYGPDGGEYTMHSFDNLTADATYDKITEYLVAPSRDGDVSLFFMASHGDPRAADPWNSGRLWCKDRDTWIPLPRLADKLSAVKGKVIVVLQSCGTGAAIRDFDTLGNASAGDSDDETYIREMSESVISAFSAADPGLEQYEAAVLDEDGGLSKSPNKFLTSKFLVMVACGYRQWSKFYDSNTNNVFPYQWAQGVGTSGIMPADVYYGNGNGELTAVELYRYVYDHIKQFQTPGMYPENSDYVLFKR